MGRVTVAKNPEFIHIHRRAAYSPYEPRPVGPIHASSFSQHPRVRVACTVICVAPPTLSIGVPHSTQHLFAPRLDCNGDRRVAQQEGQHGGVWFLKYYGFKMLESCPRSKF